MSYYRKESDCRKAEDCYDFVDKCNMVPALFESDEHVRRGRP